MSDLLQAKQIFVDALLTCRSFNAAETRNTIVGELPFGNRIERSPKNLDDVWNIVNCALDQPDGIDELMKKVHIFESDSIPFQRLDAVTQHLQYIHSDGQSGRLLEAQETDHLRDNILRDSLITQLIFLFDQPQVEVELLARIYQDCFPPLLRRDQRFLQANLHRSLLRLFETKYGDYGYGFGICVFASVIGQHFSIWDEANLWIDRAMSKMAWQFHRAEVEEEADVVLQQIENEQVVHLQVEITALSADNTLISADLYHWCQPDRSDLSHHKIEETTFAELPDEIDEQIDGRALIELFLPTKLMHMNVEFSDEKEYSLVVEHKVVRRFVDRQKIAKMTKQTPATKRQRRHYQYWVDKWDRVKQCNSLADLFHPIQPLALNSKNSLANLRIDLKNQSGICCTGCDDHPDNHVDELFHELLLAHIASGIPIMFWPGKARKLDLEMIKQERLCIQLHSLLIHLQEMQVAYLKESEQDFHHHNLFIIYDDPDRMLPWASSDRRTSFREDKINE